MGNYNLQASPKQQNVCDFAAKCRFSANLLTLKKNCGGTQNIFSKKNV